jgi:hypothetical protein
MLSIACHSTVVEKLGQVLSTIVEISGKQIARPNGFPKTLLGRIVMGT